MAWRLDPPSDPLAQKTRGPKIPANFSTTEKNPKNSPDFSRGIIDANNERLSDWLPPWTSPTRIASRKKWVELVM